MGVYEIHAQCMSVLFTVKKSKHAVEKKKRRRKETKRRSANADPNGYLVISNYLLLSLIHCNVFSVVI